MILRVPLTSFYSRGDEQRLFGGFDCIPAITRVVGVGRHLELEVELAALTNEDVRELVALLWRYGIPLTALRAFAEKKKFHWLDDPQGYWHASMFD